MYSFQTACHYCKNWNLIFMHPGIISQLAAPLIRVSWEWVSNRRRRTRRKIPRMTRPWNPTLRKTKGGAPGGTPSPIVRWRALRGPEGPLFHGGAQATNGICRGLHVHLISHVALFP